MGQKLDFNSLIQTSADDVKPPVTMPAGHYEAMIAGAMTPHEARSGNVAMRFPFRLTSATDDVDAEQLESVGGIPDKVFNIDFWMSPDAQYRFVDFAKSCGVETEGRALSEIAEQLVENQTQFTIEAKHEPNEDPEKPPFVRWDSPVGNEG